MTILPMDKSKLNEYAALYTKVFNGEPWRDSWTMETASMRLAEMMEMPRFMGMESRTGHRLAGIILGHGEPHFDGVHAQILEFCVDDAVQGNGIGTALLEHFCAELERQGISNVFLLTSRGERTQGFYANRGFTTAENMVLMSRRLSD